MEDRCVITREITVAPGVFAPGHLGELTQVVPFEMVDQALAATGTTQARVRVLPARVVVYLLLAGCLFAELGYRQVGPRGACVLNRGARHASVRARTTARRASRPVRARGKRGAARGPGCRLVCLPRPLPGMPIRHDHRQLPMNCET